MAGKRLFAPEALVPGKGLSGLACPGRGRCPGPVEARVGMGEAGRWQVQGDRESPRPAPALLHLIAPAEVLL